MSTLEIAREVLRTESTAISSLQNHLNENFELAVESILGSAGHLVVCGMGKSGLVGRKLSATLASTGTPSFFMHPGEAFHGDLGMVMPGDILLAISNSGETEEIIKLIPFLQSREIPVIAMTGNYHSRLAESANIHLYAGVEAEACPLKLVPTASTTAAMALGDALAVALMKCRNFKEENFAMFHPGGSLGRKLYLKSADVMRTKDLPSVSPLSKMPEVIKSISSGRLGLTVVLDEKQSVLGVITDGDLARTLNQLGIDSYSLTAKDMMVPSPVMVKPSTKLGEVERLIAERKITSVLVEEQRRLVGIVQIYDL